MTRLMIEMKQPGPDGPPPRTKAPARGRTIFPGAPANPNVTSAGNSITPAVCMRSAPCSSPPPRVGCARQVQPRSAPSGPGQSRSTPSCFSVSTWCGDGYFRRPAVRGLPGSHLVAGRVAGRMDKNQRSTIPLLPRKGWVAFPSRPARRGHAGDLVRHPKRPLQL